MEAVGDPDRSNFPRVVEAKARLEDVGEKGKERIGNSKYRQLFGEILLPPEARK